MHDEGSTKEMDDEEGMVMLMSCALALVLVARVGGRTGVWQAFHKSGMRSLLGLVTGESWTVWP